MDGGWGAVVAHQQKINAAMVHMMQPTIASSIREPPVAERRQPAAP